MKKIFFVILIMVLSFLAVDNAKSQYLYSSITQIQDSITLTGSTDAGSRWFTNTNDCSLMFVEIYNGAYWKTFEINYPGKMLGNLRLYYEGADTTLRVQSDQGSKYIDIPVKVGLNDNQTNIDCGGATDAGGAPVFTIASPVVVRFRGIKKSNL